MKKGRVFFLMVFFLAATASLSNADTITFGLAQVLSGDTPIGTSPWLTATFVDTGSSQVQLSLNAANLTGGTQFISQFYFNVVVSLIAGPPPDFTLVSGAEATDIGLSLAGIPAGPAGLFNIEFDFATSNSSNNSNRFDAGESVIYNISWAGVSANSFNLANSSGYYSAAHVQGIPLSAGAEGSSWLVAPPATAPVPEPATIILLSCGMAGLTFFGRKKFFA